MTRLVRPSHFCPLTMSVSWLSALVAAAVASKLCVQRPGASTLKSGRVANAKNGGLARWCRALVAVASSFEEKLCAPCHQSQQAPALCLGEVGRFIPC